MINNDDFLDIKNALPGVFNKHIKNEKSNLLKLFPLLDILLPNRELIERLKSTLQIPTIESNEDSIKSLSALCDQLEPAFDIQNPFLYRLPIVLSEFPVRSRAVNQEIAAFNQIIEDYHQIFLPLDPQALEACYKKILNALKEQGAHCDPFSIQQIVSMLCGWSTVPINELLTTITITPKKDQPVAFDYQANPVTIHEQNSSTPPKDSPFVNEYTYNVDNAGRIADETYYVLVNLFGIKTGGHLDSQVKYAPQLINLDVLHAVIFRQLSHRLDIQPSIPLKQIITASLEKLGVSFYIKNTDGYKVDALVNPFLKQAIRFLNSAKIKAVLYANKNIFDENNTINFDEKSWDILADYLFELLQKFQINPGQALGIGANADGTVDTSTEAGTDAFKFLHSNSAWGKLFKLLSLHLQGPAEAKMNAATGIRHEIKALLTNFDMTTQLRVTQISETLYAAIIDNVVARILPHPTYFENNYQKFSKQLVVEHNNTGISIHHFYVPNPHGTFFRNTAGAINQTPYFVEPGTLTVRPFPRETQCCEQSRSYAGNPLAPLQAQHLQSLHAQTRGDIVYNPTGPDQFVPNPFKGQVIKFAQDDYVIMKGVVPKNFSTVLGLPTELCSSFVIRMLHSSSLGVHCETFVDAIDQLMTNFLPPKDTNPPDLPAFSSNALLEKRQQLMNELLTDPRRFDKTEAYFHRLFKHIIYSLYDLGREDEHFKHAYLGLIYSNENFSTISRAHCENMIRDLTVNKPIFVTQANFDRYQAMLSYLTDLTTYFYPYPTNELAQAIANQARELVPQLQASHSVKTYFDKIRDNKAANLSRTQSPGMAHATLKHGKPFPAIIKQFSQMHGANFQSHYRDADGTPVGVPESPEILMDGGSKFAGALLQCFHRYNPCAIITRPLSQPCFQASESAANHPNQPLTTAWSAVRGFFWDGCAVGAWQTAITPLTMLKDASRYVYKACFEDTTSTKSENPLSISAAPANLPSPKIIAYSQSSDFLLQLTTDETNDRPHWGKICQDWMRLVSLEIDLFENPLADNEWDNLFKPLLDTDEDNQCAAFLETHKRFINKSLLQAVFHCITHKKILQHSADVIKKATSSFYLNGRQQELLTQLIQLYLQKTPIQQSQWVYLFQFNGSIHRTLELRMQAIHKLLNVFSELFEAHHPEGKIAGCKEREQQKWTQFSERELKHALISPTDAKVHFDQLEQQLAPYAELTPLIQLLKQLYTELNPDNVETFFALINNIAGHITRHKDAQQLLTKLTNITFNAIVNARLDRVDIFNSNAQNPLLGSTAISQWLLQLQKQHDLRSLLKQQVQESNSIEQALVRCKFILHVLENQQNDHRIRKTGLTPLLRFWGQHKNNVTTSGEQYFDPDTCMARQCDRNTFFKGSTTFEYKAEKLMLEKLAR